MTGLLDRYLLREWVRILLIAAVGSALIVTVFEITDGLDQHLQRGIAPARVAFGYLYSLPDKIFMVLPAAVLFATLFSIGAMNRHNELTAAKASGRSVRRVFLPVFAAAAVAAVACFYLGEWAPQATRTHLEILGERQVRSQTARYNFVYRADFGWVYAVRMLDINRQRMQHLVLEREGTGPDYPTLVVQSPEAVYDTAARHWTLRSGRFRIVPGDDADHAFAFDEMRMRSLVESPDALLVEPKDPKAMTYAELARYIDDLERSGGDGRRLRVRLALKIAIPFTCLVIALFGAPLALTAPRGSGAVGIALGLGVTVVFLTLVQLAEAIAGGGLLPPVLAAWFPNAVFGAAGVVMLWKART